MNPVSARTLAWTAVLLIVLAPAIISPTGTFPLLVLAAICAAIPALFAVKRCRIVSIVLFCISLTLAVSYYPGFKQDQEIYRRRANERLVAPPIAMPADQGITRK